MTKIVDPNIHSNVAAPRSIRQGNRALPANTLSANNLELFSKILADTIGETTGKGETPSGATPLLQQELIRLITTVQYQMDTAFFNAFDESEDENPLTADAMDWSDMGNASLMDGNTAFMGTDGPFISNVPVSNVHHTTGQMTPPVDINSIINEASKMYDVDAGLIQAVIKAESDFDPNSTSSKGAMGLMQLMPETAKDLGVTDAYDPVQNIHGGTRYLKGLLDRYEGNVPLALAAYNWGMGNVERHPDRLPRETQVYISRVNQFYQEMKA